MKVARSGLMNGLKLKLMGEGEIKRLWCSEPDRAPPGKLRGRGNLKSHLLRVACAWLESAMIPTGSWPCPGLRRSIANNPLEQARRDEGLGLRAGAMSTSARPHDKTAQLRGPAGPDR
jgi:hypothetical protein